MRGDWTEKTPRIDKALMDALSDVGMDCADCRPNAEGDGLLVFCVGEKNLSRLQRVPGYAVTRHSEHRALIREALPPITDPREEAPET